MEFSFQKVSKLVEQMIFEKFFDKWPMARDYKDAILNHDTEKNKEFEERYGFDLLDIWDWYRKSCVRDLYRLSYKATRLEEFFL
jgi:lipopolysaccharide biosynthesis protein